MPPSPMPSEWRIRSTWSNTPPSSSTSAAGGSNKSCWDTAAGRAIHCSGPATLGQAHERLDERGNEKLTGLLEAGDPKGQVRMAWHAKESVRELYTPTDAEVALTFVDELVADMATRTCRPQSAPSGEPSSVGGSRSPPGTPLTSPTAHRGGQQLDQAGQTAAFGFTSFRNYRVRSLLHAGRPYWSLLATITPR